MGQQQILLIVLGVIIIGTAVVFGITLFNNNAEQSAQETVVSDAMNIAVLARQYLIKPTSQGGGGGSFSGFTAPDQLMIDSAASVKFKVNASKKKVTITGTPFKKTKYTWKVKTIVKSESITTTIQ